MGGIYSHCGKVIFITGLLLWGFLLVCTHGHNGMFITTLLITHTHCSFVVCLVFTWHPLNVWQKIAHLLFNNCDMEVGVCGTKTTAPKQNFKYLWVSHTPTFVWSIHFTMYYQCLPFGWWSRGMSVLYSDRLLLSIAKQMAIQNRMSLGLGVSRCF